MTIMAGLHGGSGKQFEFEEAKNVDLPFLKKK